MIENIYDTLQTQYKKLTDEEKNAILVYKSFLFYHINEIASIPNYEDISPSDILEKIKKPKEFIYQYENFKNIIKQPQNITIKYTVFGKINTTSIEQFIESLKKIIQILNNTKYKIMVNTPIITYRGISSKTPIQDISKSNLVSTSLTIETADKFLFASKKNPYNTLYIFQIEEKIPVLISPYNIINNYHDIVNLFYDKKDRMTLKLTKDQTQNQQEIILFKDTIDYEKTATKQLILEKGQTLTIQYISVKQKNATKTK